MEVRPARIPGVAAPGDLLASPDSFADLVQRSFFLEVVVPRITPVRVPYSNEIRSRSQVRLRAAASKMVDDRRYDTSSRREHGRAHGELKVEGVA